jgi:hypothetical protein
VLILLRVLESWRWVAYSLRWDGWRGGNLRNPFLNQCVDLVFPGLMPAKESRIVPIVHSSIAKSQFCNILKMRRADEVGWWNAGSLTQLSLKLLYLPIFQSNPAGMPTNI